MSNFVKNKDVRTLALGRTSYGSKVTVPQNATTTLFTVANGRILTTLLYGVVTTVIAGTTPSLKLIATPTTGTANDMCTALVITSDEAGMQYVLPPLVGSALTGIASTGKSGSASVTSGGQIVAPGTIGMNVSASDATGAIQWSLFYIALDDNATVVAV